MFTPSPPSFYQPPQPAVTPLFTSFTPTPVNTPVSTLGGIPTSAPPLFYTQPSMYQPITSSIQATNNTNPPPSVAYKSPFIKEIHDYDMPNTAKLPHLKTYNGTTYPDSHIDTYEWHMQSLKLDERFWCTHFPTTLDGNAGAWFKSLAPNSIRNFTELKEQFLSNFMQLRKYRGDIREIIGCKQLEGEPIRAYFKRFNEATLNVPGQNDNLVTGAFTHGLLPGPLSTKFLGKPPATRQEMKERVERFLRQKEGTAAKEAYLKAAATSSSKTRENHSQYLGDRRQPFRRGKHQKPYNNHYRVDKRYKRTDILVVAKKNKQARRTSERPRDQSKYCEFHKCYGHNTAECAVLKKELDQRIQRGNLNDIAKSIRPKNGRNDTLAKNMDAPKKGPEILVIHKHQRRAREQTPDVDEQQISFSSRDKKPEGWNGDDPLIIQARVRDIIIHRVHIDSGSAADIMFEHCFRQLPREWRTDLRPPAGNLTGFTGHNIIPTGMIYLPITIDDGQRKKTVTLEFTVVRAPSEHNIILGRPAALYFGIVASTLHGIIKFPTDAGVATVLATPQKTLKCCQIMLPADIDGKRKRPRGEPEESREIIYHDFPDQKIQVGSTLPTELRKHVISLLRKYKHVFAWEPADMVGVERTIIEHNLNIVPGSNVVKQKRRGQAGERNNAINAEVTKLVQADIVREAFFPTWIANPVMVKKSDGSWRMCIDYTDLNKACPKDCYPLPEIDQKVESLEGFKWKCFLDAYKGYHQILMRKEDEDKTAFYTDHGTFCYQKMPFGLKNAGATYQRLVDKAFKDQIGRNVEVYVDDMVIKSRAEQSLLQDIEETLKTLSTIQMKLNPAKCTFGVEEGKFLGYYVTREGIQPNPEKIKDFVEIKSPACLREIQGLNGKLTALGRFVAKSTEKAHPLFNTLKGCINKNNFRWTNEAEIALTHLK
ncbi:hypothetical protein L2E82_39064 [Cichorium intybus]|uniref:Uncharacterized protein n=1 Tax=Cichorium intybus TaxID=13427 RepID=A0ACB9AGF1_CICIN|nr:hypothetical protein L2E82_39064 [Cichorium intybus]